MPKKSQLQRAAELLVKAQEKEAMASKRKALKLLKALSPDTETDKLKDVEWAGKEVKNQEP